MTEGGVGSAKVEAGGVVNHVFSDRAKADSGHGAFSMALTISRIGLQPTNLNP